MKEQALENNTVASFLRLIHSNQYRLVQGERLKILLKDGYLTIYNEIDESTKETKTITLINEFDFSLNLSVSDLIQNN